MAKNSPKKKQRKTYDLRLTKFELVHIRDMFSVVLPPELTKTLSQSLCEVEERQSDEASLWKKIVELCLEANIPVGDDAPSYVVAPAASPPLSVFQLVTEEEGGEESPGNEG